VDDLRAGEVETLRDVLGGHEVLDAHALAHARQSSDLLGSAVPAQRRRGPSASSPRSREYGYTLKAPTSAHTHERSFSPRR
jgi:hypothetical protein